MVIEARVPVLHLERCYALLPQIDTLEIGQNANPGIDLLANRGIKRPMSLARAVEQRALQALHLEQGGEAIKDGLDECCIYVLAHWGRTQLVEAHQAVQQLQLLHIPSAACQVFLDQQAGTKQVLPQGASLLQCKSCLGVA